MPSFSSTHRLRLVHVSFAPYGGGGADPVAWSTRHVINLSARSHMPAFPRTRTLCCSWPRAGIGARLDHAQPEVVHPCARHPRCSTCCYAIAGRSRRLCRLRLRTWFVGSSGARTGALVRVCTWRCVGAFLCCEQGGVSAPWLDNPAAVGACVCGRASECVCLCYK